MRFGFRSAHGHKYFNAYIVQQSGAVAKPISSILHLPTAKFVPTWRRDIATPTLSVKYICHSAMTILPQRTEMIRDEVKMRANCSDVNKTKSLKTKTTGSKQRHLADLTLK